MNILKKFLTEIKLIFLVIRKSPVECPDEIINNTVFPLEFIPYLIQGENDTFFQ
jgi:hypothetical protein